MAEDNQEGVGQQPVSREPAGRYADYYEDNKDEVDEAGTSDTQTPASPEEPAAVKPAPGKPEAKPEAPAAPEKVHVPHWQRKINKQTAQIRQLEEELAAMKAPKEPAPKYTRDHFLSDEEYQDWKQTQRVNSAIEGYKVEQVERQLGQARASVDDETFRASWSERVQQNFEGDPEGFSVFKEALKGVPRDYLPKDVHEYVQSTDVGPRMLQILLLRPDIVQKLNGAPNATVRAGLLARLDMEITTALRGRAPAPVAPQAPQKPVSRAPAPIGQVGAQGNALSDEESEEDLYHRLMKKKHGVRTR